MRVRRRHVVGLAALLAAAGSITAIWNWTPLVPDRIGALLSDNLLRERGYRVQLDAVRRTWSGEIVFLRPRVQSLADTTLIVVRAEALRVRIRRPWTALRGRVTFTSLRVERPQVHLPATPLGRPPAAAAAPGGYPRVVVDALQIVDGSLWDAAGVLLVEHADATLRIRSRRASVRVDVERASGMLVRDSLHLVDGAARLGWRADTLRVQAARVQLASTRVEGEGLYLPAARAGRFSGTLAPLDLDELGRFLPAAGRRSGRLRGSARIEWRGQAAAASGRVSGVVDSVRLQDVEFDATVDAERWAVRRVAGLVNEQQLEARAAGAWGAPRWNAHLRLEAADLGRLVPPRWRPSQLAVLPPHSLSGTLQLQHTNGDTLQLGLELERSRVRDIPIDRLSGTAFLASRILRVPKLAITSSLGDAELSGTLRADSLEAEFDLVTLQAERLLERVGAAGARGDLALHGRVHGPLRSLSFETEGSSAAFTSGPFTLWSAEVAGWGQRLGRTPELDLEVRADSLRVHGHVLRGLTSDVTYAAHRLTVRRVQAAAGDTLLAGAGSIESLPADWTGTRLPTTRLHLETALVRFGDTELRVEDPATVWWRPGAVRVDSLLVASRGGRLGLDGVLDRTARRIDARARLDDFDLAYVRRFLLTRHRYGGRASGWLAARGDLAGTPLQGELRVEGGDWNGLAVDSLTVGLRTRDEHTELHAVRMVTPRGTLHGSLQLGALPHLERWLEPHPAAAAHWEQATLGGRLEFRDLDVAQVWAARTPAAKPPGWGGRLSATLALGGTLAAPQFEIQGSATAVHAARIALETVHFDAIWAEDQLRLRSVDIDVDGQRLHAEAVLPLGLRLRTGVVMARHQPLEAELTVPRTSFAAVERFLPIFEPPPVEIPRGEVEGNVRLSGTIEALEWSGGFQVQRASFAMRDLEEVYRDVSGTGVFAGSTLRLEALRGRSGEKGTLAGAGRLEFDRWQLADYFWGFELQQVPVRSIPDITAIVSGRLEIHAERIGAKLVPDVRGTLAVQAGEIRSEFVASGTAAQPVVDTDVPEWLADISLAADQGNVWIRNSVVDAELVGNLRFIRRREGEVQGLVRVKRGTYSYLIHRFEITSGELDFSRTGAFFDPELSIEARRGRPGDRTYVTMSGRASAPQLSFRSDRAQASSDQIQQDLLAVGGPESQAAQTAIADFAEQTLRDLALLSDVSIDPAALDEGAAGGTTTTRSAFSYNVSAAREISNRVFLIYTQGVNSDLAQRVAVEFDIGRWLLLETLYERRSVTEAGIDQPQNAYELNLKYRYEY